MTNNRNSKLNIWEVETLRVTGFPSPTTNLTNIDTWWKAIVGNEPVNIIETPKKGEKRFNGNYKGGFLTLRIQPIRIDWLYNVHRERQINSDEFKTLGSYDEVIEKFLSITFRWVELQEFPSMIRIAFAPNLIQRANSMVEGNDILTQYMKFVELDVENTRDFSYQINRRRPSSTIDDLKINRLSKWTNRRIKSTIVQMQPEDLIRKRITQLQDIYQVKLSLDINTIDEYDKEFNKSQSAKIFKELIENAEEIAIKGDVP